MTKRFAWCIFLGIALVLWVPYGRAQNNGINNGMSEDHTCIHVVANGLEHNAGQVLVALFLSREGFPSDTEMAIQRGVAHMDSTVATFTFNPVPQGEYAVSVLHDEDGNGEMKTAMFGRPAEGWGVSRDAKARFGPPKFKDATFAAHQDSVLLELKLRY